MALRKWIMARAADNLQNLLHTCAKSYLRASSKYSQLSEGGANSISSTVMDKKTPYTDLELENIDME